MHVSDPRSQAWGGRLALALVVALSSSASAVTGTVTQLSAGSASATQTYPQVSGSHVVWTDVVTATRASDIFYLDVTGSAPARNLTNTASDHNFLEDVDGNNVVWTRSNPLTAGDIVVYDVATNISTTAVAGSTTRHAEQPALSGRYLAFVSVANQIDIDAYDVFLGMPLANKITNDAAVQAHPRIFGDMIVYEDYNTAFAAVKGYRIATNSTFTITGGASNRTYPDVDGGHVVYLDDAGGTDTVWLYDLVSGATHAVTTAPSHKIQPRVSGNYVVWADDRNAGSGFDIYLYDIASASEQLLVGGPGDQVLADLDGPRVVYTSNANGFEQVYLYTIDSGPALPFGCDPATTDPVGAPVTMNRTHHHPVFAHGSIAATAGRDYYVCIENGRADGSQRTAHLVFAADGARVLGPADFAPAANPPRYVAKKLTLTCGGGDHGDGEHGGGDHGDGEHGGGNHRDGDHSGGDHGDRDHRGGDHQGDDDDHDGPHCDHEWAASLFGAELPATATVSIRVAR